MCAGTDKESTRKLVGPSPGVVCRRAAEWNFTGHLGCIRGDRLRPDGDSGCADLIDERSDVLDEHPGGGCGEEVVVGVVDSARYAGMGMARPITHSRSAWSMNDDGVVGEGGVDGCVRGADYCSPVGGDHFHVQGRGREDPDTCVEVVGDGCVAWASGADCAVKEAHRVPCDRNPEGRACRRSPPSATRSTGNSMKPYVINRSSCGPESQRWDRKLGRALGQDGRAYRQTYRRYA